MAGFVYKGDKMEFKITKNNFPDLNCFFKKRGFQNISRPCISYLKVDSSSRIQPIYHIGFHDNMGFLDSIKINAGIMVFEVLEGYPLQDLLLSNNKNSLPKGYKFRLEDLESMDFYCVQNKNEDVYGDFILKNLKFTGTKLEQSTENFGRRMIAEFICSSMIPFRISSVNNHFISDDYDYHIIRNKNEITEIIKDIQQVADKIPASLARRLITILTGNKNFKLSSDFDMGNDIIIALNKTFQEMILDYVKKSPYNDKLAVFRIQKFIAEFYKFKNPIAEQEARDDKRLNLLRYKNLSNIKGE